MKKCIKAMDNTTQSSILFRLMQDVGLGTDTEICQYMYLGHLISLLEKKKYYVKRKKEFPDMREKEIPHRFLFTEFTIPNGKLSAEQVDRSKRKSESIHNFEKVSSALLTSCWTERITENILMWERGKDEDKPRVCIKSCIGDFVKAFEAMDFTIWCGKMLYEPFYPVLMSDDIIWYKEPYFSDEREIRFYFSKDFDRVAPDDGIDNHIDLPVDIQTLIHEIILSPDATKQDKENVLRLIEPYNITVTSSKIETNQIDNQ